MDESTLLYAASHEWARLEGNTCVVGITRFAVEQLTDIVYIELPAVGTELTKGSTFGVIESVKAVSDLYAPVSGKVIAVNQAVVDDPGMLGDDPYEKGWMIKLEIAGTPDTSHLKDKAAYDAQVASEAH
ncbi:MAG: glycine cleavage system protein GcvH [Planctomycetota bacterium]